MIIIAGNIELIRKIWKIIHALNDVILCNNSMYQHILILLHYIIWKMQELYHIYYIW